jgi:hypothetical protein
MHNCKRKDIIKINLKKFGVKVWTGYRWFKKLSSDRHSKYSDGTFSRKVLHHGVSYQLKF